MYVPQAPYSSAGSRWPSLMYTGADKLATGLGYAGDAAEVAKWGAASIGEPATATTAASIQLACRAG